MTPGMPPKVDSITFWKIEAAFFIPIWSLFMVYNPFVVFITDNCFASSSSSICQYASLRSNFAKYCAPSNLLNRVSWWGSGKVSDSILALTWTLKSAQSRNPSFFFFAQTTGLAFADPVEQGVIIPKVSNLLSSFLTGSCNGKGTGLAAQNWSFAPGF